MKMINAGYLNLEMSQAELLRGASDDVSLWGLATASSLCTNAHPTQRRVLLLRAAFHVPSFAKPFPFALSSLAAPRVTASL